MAEVEKFKKTFEKLHASPDVLTEVMNMAVNEKIVPIRKRKYMNKIAVAIAAVVLAVGSGSMAYAMDLGGIQRVVQIWIHGDQTDAIFTVNNGSYSLDYQDSEGKDVHQGGGGVAIHEDGTERPLTEEELLEEISSPEVIYENDGRVMVYYRNQEMDITDKFEDGFCFLQVNAGDHTEYMTVKYQEGYAMSPHGYIQPSEF